MSDIHYPPLISDDQTNLDVQWSDALVTELKRRSDELKSGHVRGLTSQEVFGTPL